MASSILNRKRLDSLAAMMGNKMEEQLCRQFQEALVDIMHFNGKNSQLSQSRYNKIVEFLESNMSQHKDDVLCMIHNVLNYDPDDNTQKEKRRQYCKQYYERKKAEGISSYIITGQKNLYYRRKQAAEALQKMGQEHICV